MSQNQPGPQWGPQPGQPAQPFGAPPQAPKQKPALWRRGYMIAGYVVVSLAVGAAAGGGGSDSAATAASGSKPSATATVTAAAKPAPTVTVTAAAAAPAKSTAVAPKTVAKTDGGIASDGDWTLVTARVSKEDFSGDFTGTARIRYDGEATGGDGMFTISIFKGSSQDPLTTFTVSVNNVEPGKIVSEDLLSTDKYVKGPYRIEFQKDF